MQIKVLKLYWSGPAVDGLYLANQGNWIKSWKQRGATEAFLEVML